MELNKESLGTLGLSLAQTKLTTVYRVAKQPPDVEKKVGHNLDGLFRLANFGLIKQEPVEYNVLANGSQEIDRRNRKYGLHSLSCRDDNMLLVSPGEEQAGSKSFPYVQLLTQQLGGKDLVISTEPGSPACLSLKRVKLELHSPGSCVTNVWEASQTSSDVELLSQASMNLITSDSDPDNVEQYNGASPVEAPQCPEQAPVALGPPLKPHPFMISSVMIQDYAIVDNTKRPATVIENPLPSQRILTSVKTKVVEVNKKLVTALDVFRGGLLSASSFTPPNGGELQAQIPSDSVPNKLMTALHMLPEKLESRENPPVEITYWENPLPQRGNVAVVRVKSEPLDIPGGIEAGDASVRVGLQNREIVQVNENILNPSGFFSDSVEYEVPRMLPSDSDETLTESDDTDDTEGGRLPTKARNGAHMGSGDVVDMITCISDKWSDGGLEKSQKEIKPRNSNPGRRIQGGRIYDSSFGKTCHWCRQKTVEHHVKCRECTIHFCGPCLMNRNGENIREELAEGVRWLCPKCRNGCGSGCNNCCNCGPCRKADGKAPTGQVVFQARNAGFENVHDYLVHLETGETSVEIAQRKVGRDWTNCGRFKCTDTSGIPESREDASESEAGEEFTLNEETSTQVHQGKLGMRLVKKFVQSQKRKRGAMRGSLPAKRMQHEFSPAYRRQDVDSIPARLEGTGQENSKEKTNEVSFVNVGVDQTFNTKEKPIQNDLTYKRNQNSGMKTNIKREHVDMNSENGTGETYPENLVAGKRRKLEAFGGNQRQDVLYEVMSSRSSLISPFSEVSCKVEPITFSEDNRRISGDCPSIGAGSRRKLANYADIPGGQVRTTFGLGSEPILRMRGASASRGVMNGLSSASTQMVLEQRGMECPSDPQGTIYRSKLKSALAHPFDAKEMATLDESARCRKPIQKLRQMRGRIVDVITEDEGLSYLDHHQDFALKLEEAASPPEKLALLRGFFFWLQHSCMEGAFRPWLGALTEFAPQSGDCIETEGPDCQVTAVVLQLDEAKDASHQVESKNVIHLDDGKGSPRLDEVTEAPRRLKRKYTKKIPRPPEVGRESRKPVMIPSIQTLIPFQAKKNSFQPVKAKMRTQQTSQPVVSYRVVLCLPAPAL